MTPRNEATTAGAATFVEPDVLRSRDGRVEVDLVASSATWPGAPDGALSYNNAPIGPTLRLRPGDRVTVNVENRLDVATNLHTHGLGVSPTSPADDVFVRIEPGEARRYDYVLPVDHPSGLFWYHPHQHGDVARQVGAGLVGAIIVDDDLDDTDAMAATSERLWVLHDPTSADRSVSPMDQMHGRAGADVLVNGVSQPLIETTSGRLERWRIVNASASRIMPFAVDELAMTVIGTDAGRLAESVEVNGLVLFPGERVEVLVEAASTGTRHTVMGDGPLAVLATSATPAPKASGAAPVLRETSDFEIGAVTARRTLRLGADMSGGMMSQDSLAFTIDAKTFDPDRVDISTQLGEVEEWTIVNDTGMDHPFHLHAWPFQVVDEDGWPGWKDTVNVPGGGEVMIRIPFVGHSGRSVYHCHILDHEDIGMMGVINVTAGE